MAAVTLTTLRARSRERADLTGSNFVTDTATGIDAWINEGAAELHDLLISAYGNNYVVSSSAFTTVSGTTNYNLPADFYKLLGVELKIGAREVNLKKYPFAERNAYRGAVSSAWGAVLPRYRLEGSVLRLYPAPEGAYTGTFWYAPTLALLVAGSDTVNFLNGWEKYVVAYAARLMKLKEESDSRGEEADLGRWKSELDALAANRDAGTPEQVVDTERVDIDPHEIY